MLIGNHTVLNKTPGRWLGGTNTAHASGIGAGQVGLRSNWSKAGARRNFAYQDRSTGALEYFGVPTGYGGKSWILPIEAGYLSSVNVVKGLGAFIGAGALGKNATASIAGLGAFTATGALVVSATASISGVGAFTGNILAALGAEATIAGTASATASITALAWGVTAITGTATMTGTRYATGELEAAITPFTELSPQSLADAVWSQALESGYTAEEIVRLMSSTLLGKASGAGTGTIVFRDMGDTADRVSAEVDGTGNRTAVTLDAA